MREDDAVRRPRTDADWDALCREFGGQRSEPLRSTFDAIRSHGCSTVIVERDYVCQDFRSEYVAHWAHRHRVGSPFTTRLHFFADEIAFEDLHRLDPSLRYLGYAVIRPVAHGSLGRTVVMPPATLPQRRRLATVTDEVSVFGTRFVVEGTPFAQQDGEFVRCAHAAAWICHYVAHRRGLVGRRSMADFIHVPPDMLSAERPLPSQGLNPMQLQALFGSFGQPAQFYPISKLPTVIGIDSEDETGPVSDLLPRGLWPDGRIVSVACRYINAGFPVLVGTVRHAFVLVGWFKRDGKVRFVACDDQRGPYEIVEDIAHDERAPWMSLMVPLPPKVWLTAEAVELDACTSMMLGQVKPDKSPALAGLGELFPGHISVRTTLMRSTDYKVSLLSQRGRPDRAVRALRLASLPYWVWIVEAQLREARERGAPCVVGEFVYDPTSSRDAGKLALSAPYYDAIVYGSRPEDPKIIQQDDDEVAVWGSHFNPPF